MNAKVIGKIIDELHQEGKTILFSTHVLPQAEQICNRIVMIDQGTKVLDGTIESIRERNAKLIKISGSLAKHLPELDLVHANGGPNASTPEKQAAMTDVLIAALKAACLPQSIICQPPRNQD